MYGFIAWGFVFDVVHVHAIVDYGVLLGLSGIAAWKVRDSMAVQAGLNV